MQRHGFTKEIPCIQEWVWVLSTEEIGETSKDAACVGDQTHSHTEGAFQF